MKNIFKNPIQKLLAITIALAIWFFAPAPDKKDLSEVQFFAAVSYVNLPKNLEIVSERVKSISVSVEIPQNEVPKIHPSMFQVVIDLENSIPGESDFRISKDILKMPPNVRVIQILPSSLSLKFEEIIEKTLPISAVFVGEPAEGLVLEKVLIEPATVKVKGPISVLKGIEQLETKTINIEKVKNNMELFIHMAFPKRVVAIDPKPEFYVAKIRVGYKPFFKRLFKIPIGIVNQTYITRINPKHFNVLLRGPRGLIQDFTKDDIQAFIDLKGYEPGEYKVEAPTVRLRPEIQIQATWPPIDIWVKKQKAE